MSAPEARDWMRDREMPTVIDNNHESLYRCYIVLQRVRAMLKDGVPADYIISIINLIEGEKP